MMASYNPQFIVSRMRLARGDNYMLCQYGATEIQKLRKEIKELKKLIEALNKNK